ALPEKTYLSYAPAECIVSRRIARAFVLGSSCRPRLPRESGRIRGKPGHACHATPQQSPDYQNPASHDGPGLTEFFRTAICQNDRQKIEFLLYIANETD